MKVFLSWSGEKSRAVAMALRDWLPSVINEVDPFVSAKDIAAGARWQTEIADQLESTAFGIVCVTAGNRDARWLNFEAGALAKALGPSRVVPLAIDLKLSDVRLPLAQFQAQPMSKDGIVEVLRSLNAQCTKPLPEQRLAEACKVWWPSLESKFQEVPEDRSEPISTSALSCHLPRAAIEEPANGSTVGLTAIVSGRSNRVPSAETLWAVVTRGRTHPYHPQGALNVRLDGGFEGTAHFGLPATTGIFELELVLVDAAGARQFREYLSHATARGTYPGVPSPPPGAQILDHIEVARG